MLGRHCQGKVSVYIRIGADVGAFHHHAHARHRFATVVDNFAANGQHGDSPGGRSVGTGRRRRFSRRIFIFKKHDAVFHHPVAYPLRDKYLVENGAECLIFNIEGDVVFHPYSRWAVYKFYVRLALQLPERKADVGIVQHDRHFLIECLGFYRAGKRGPGKRNRQ
jgi:hypothetical protein